MGTGYNRTDTTNNIATGNIINASDLDAEYDAIDAAFDETTGHDHGGASGNGAPITKVGPVQDLVVSASTVTPKTTNTLDLGTPLLKFKDLNLSGNALVAGTLGITGNTTFAGAIISDSTTDSTSTTTGAIQTDGGLGVAKALWVGGLANIAGAVTLQSTLGVTGVATLNTFASSGVTITGGSINGTTVGASTASTGAFTTLAYTSTLTGGTGVINIGSGQIYKDASGNSGFGTTTTTYRLNVADTNSRVWNKSFSTGHSIFHTENDGGSFYFAIDNSTGTAFGNGNYARVIRSTGAYPMTFDTNSIERMRIASSGNVGINTTSPAVKLDVKNGGTGPTPVTGTVARFMEATGTGYDAFVSIISGNAGAASLDFGDTDAQAPARIQYNNASGAMAITVNSAERMRIDSLGNVGMGVTPSAWASGYTALQVGSSGSLWNFKSGAAGGTYLANNEYWDGTNRIYLFSAASTEYVQLNGTHAWYTAPTGTAGASMTQTERMRLTVDGLLGIGTSSPTQLLTVAGNARFTSGSGNRYLLVESGSTSAVQLATDGTASYVYSTGAVPLIFATNAAERMRITSSGALLLGGSNANFGYQQEITGTRAGAPFQGLSIYNTSVNDGAKIAFLDDGNSAGIGNIGPNLVFYASDRDTERMRIASSGSLFAGSPSQIVGSAGVTIGQNTTSLDAKNFYRVNNRGLGTTTGTNYIIGGIMFSAFRDVRNPSDVAGIWAIRSSYAGGAASDGTLCFGTEINNGGSIEADGQTPQERMRIDPNGNLLVGTTSGAFHRFKKDVPGIIFQVENLYGSTAQTYRSSMATAAADTASYHFVGNCQVNGDRVYIFGNGNIVNTNNSYGALSDRKIKTDITPVGSQWNDVKALANAMSKFKLINDDTNTVQLGWVAQDVQAISSGLVFETKDRDAEGNLTGEITLGVQTSVAQLKAFKALGEALERIEEQQALIENLTTRLNALEGN